MYDAPSQLKFAGEGREGEEGAGVLLVYMSPHNNVSVARYSTRVRRLMQTALVQNVLSSQ